MLKSMSYDFSATTATVKLPSLHRFLEEHHLPLKFKKPKETSSFALAVNVEVGIGLFQNPGPANASTIAIGKYIKSKLRS